MQECTDFSNTKINQNGNKHVENMIINQYNPIQTFITALRASRQNARLVYTLQCNTDVTAVTDTDSAKQSMQNGSSVHMTPQKAVDK